MGLARRGADGLRVIAVVLLPPHKGLHILRADDLHLVPERFELAHPPEGACAGFDDDGAGIDLSENLEQLAAHHPTLEDRPTIAVHAMQVSG
jgi:hypothetical protein